MRDSQQNFNSSQGVRAVNQQASLGEHGGNDLSMGEGRYKKTKLQENTL
jgi:hypothetical protein